MRASGLLAGGYASAKLASASAETTSQTPASPPAPSFNVKHHGAVGNGSADDTAAIQTTIDAAAKAGGGIVLLPPGRYKTTASLHVAASSIVLSGEGAASTLAPVGDFDTVKFEAAASLYRNAVRHLCFDETEKRGGHTLAGRYVAQFHCHDVWGIAGWNAWHFHNFNCVTLTDCRFESYRGRHYGRATGGGEGGGRSDVLRLSGLVHGGARHEGITGLDIDGYVHTVSGQNIYLVAVGGKALWGHNTLGAENNPSFFTFDDLEADYPDGEAIRLEAGEHFYFTNTLVHATRTAASNIDLGPEVRGATFTGGFSTGSHQAGIHIRGRSIAVTGMHFHANSSPEFGGKKNTFPGILLGRESRDVLITACHSGREAVRDYQSHGCEVEEGADRFLIANNNFAHNVTPGIKNPAGPSPTRLIANNL